MVGANIQVEEGSFFTFLGPSGCGKTTTLRMIAGFETPTAGKVIMDGKDITERPPERREIGMMFQNYALFPHMTVYENVAYGPKVKRKGRDEIARLVSRYLEMVGLSGYEKRKITQLSGGEQQRVALARSLATEPKILLLDEPLSNLDAKMRDEMRFELKRLQHELKITMLYVTHDQNEALMMSDRIAVFYRGKIQQIGRPEEIYNHPTSSFVANFVGQTNLLAVEKQSPNEVVVTGGTRLETAGAASGAKCVSIRNEYILLSKNEDAAPGYNSVPARVTSRQFNGISTYYVIEAAGLSMDVTVTNNGLTQDYQDVVYAHIHRQHVVPLEV